MLFFCLCGSGLVRRRLARFETHIRHAPEHSDLNLLAVLKLVEEGGERKQNEFAYFS